MTPEEKALLIKILNGLEQKACYANDTVIWDMIQELNNKFNTEVPNEQSIAN